MISIDTVYQRVLAFANKEQRGYITPQEFNLFANQAQMEIFEQYFYDTNAARRVQGNDTVYADIDDMLEQKMQIFEAVDRTNLSEWEGGSPINSYYPYIPKYMYRVKEIFLENMIKAEILNVKDFNACAFPNNGPLIKPTKQRPVATIFNNMLKVRTASDAITQTAPIRIYYFRLPLKANWAYVVINEKAMYDATNAVDFELHPSEETELVYKILKYAGISMQRQDAAQAGQSMETMMKQQQSKIQ